MGAEQVKTLQFEEMMKMEYSHGDSEPVLFFIGRVTIPPPAYTATLSPLHELALMMRGDSGDMAAKEHQAG
ncbi:hypothetical protein Y032_0054g2473 [Ancylostoma ceylanicum]|nr:hypothetical protein Y032_0054g2473 [Ancylostoma ceylanicum]